MQAGASGSGFTRVINVVSVGQEAPGPAPEGTARVFGSDTAAVIHDGTDVSHLKTYALLRAANVTSIKEIERLCVAYGIIMHYISTTGVTMSADPDTCEVIGPGLGLGLRRTATTR
ncbi:hypothetical protein F4823DRAFT_561758 [Ustulina deusta]|nr:hypothetical protein F4823DRAFT_561758 [Ustulina deusta]